MACALGACGLHRATPVRFPYHKRSLVRMAGLRFKMRAHMRISRLGPSRPHVPGRSVTRDSRSWETDSENLVPWEHGIVGNRGVGARGEGHVAVERAECLEAADGHAARIVAAVPALTSISSART